MEGRRIGTGRAWCPACRERLRREHRGGRASETSRTLCFQCYRAELQRQKAFAAAARLDTASQARFQFLLPLEPVNRTRLEMLKADRAASRAAQTSRPDDFAARQRQAQIAARHALQSLAMGLRMQKIDRVARDRALATAIRAAELQLPESWLPFVVSR